MTTVLAEIICLDWTSLPWALIAKSAGRVNLELQSETFLTQQVFSFPYHILFLKKILFIHFYRERKGRRKERQGNMDVSERNISWFPFPRPHWGSIPHPRPVPWPGMEPSDLSLCRMMPNPLSHAGQHPYPGLSSTLTPNSQFWPLLHDKYFRKLLWVLLETHLLFGGWVGKHNRKECLSLFCSLHCIRNRYAGSRIKNIS